MKERIYQLGFQEFLGNPRTDVTPRNFPGLEYPETAPLPRFVREVHEQIQVRSPADTANYLMERVYAPFEGVEQEELWGASRKCLGNSEG